MIISLLFPAVTPFTLFLNLLLQLDNYTWISQCDLVVSNLSLHLPLSFTELCTKPTMSFPLCSDWKPCRHLWPSSRPVLCWLVKYWTPCIVSCSFQKYKKYFIPSLSDYSHCHPPGLSPVSYLHYSFSNQTLNLISPSHVLARCIPCSLPLITSSSCSQTFSIFLCFQ